MKFNFNFFFKKDLDAVKKNWKKIIKLKPLPLVGTQRWSRSDSYALEQISCWFPEDW